MSLKKLMKSAWHFPFCGGERDKKKIPFMNGKISTNRKQANLPMKA